MITEQELITFEQEIAKLFEAKRIKAPVHLSGGNESQLIKIFEKIKPTDWVCSTHRSHYHALLKGIPPEWIKSEILRGNSITLCNAEYRFITSAIVGGIIPIAVGLAMAGERVWCFVGDMGASGGTFYECQKYVRGHNLPITFVIENNGLSVQSPTREVWGIGDGYLPNHKIQYYEYKMIYPHQGSGVYVLFG